MLLEEDAFLTAKVFVVELIKVAHNSIWEQCILMQGAGNEFVL